MRRQLRRPAAAAPKPPPGPSPRKPDAPPRAAPPARRPASSPQLLAPPPAPPSLRLGARSPLGAPNARASPPARWRFTDLSLYTKRWDVPWGAPTVLLGVCGWAAVFACTGFVLLPFVEAFAGGPVRTLLPAQQATAVLAIQAAETGLGLFFVYLVVRPFSPLPEEWFRVDASAPLSPENGWFVWSAAGYVAAFGAIGLAASLAAAAAGGGGGAESGGGAADAAAASAAAQQGAGTVDAILPLLGSGVPSLAALFVVTAFLAPMLEEVVFRGFLLPSLTKWVPAPAAVGLSSLLFAAAHFAPRDAPQLLALGCVLGFAYVRTRNLLVPIAIHSAWNGGVLTVLALLTDDGQRPPT